MCCSFRPGVDDENPHCADDFLAVPVHRFVFHARSVFATQRVSARIRPRVISHLARFEVRRGVRVLNELTRNPTASISSAASILGRRFRYDLIECQAARSFTAASLALGPQPDDGSAAAPPSALESE